MTTVCHRGVWAQPAEQNTVAAFRAAWRHGWGVETDIRDANGDVVIAHDLPPAVARGRRRLTLRTVLEAYRSEGGGTPLALNVKADGLAVQVSGLLAEHGASNAFVFDMSVPDQLAWLREDVPTYTRWSDIEPEPLLLDRSVGIWLDAFDDDAWWDEDAVGEQLRAGRRVTLVSPELHRRDPEVTWKRVVAAELHHHAGFSMCTDRPEQWTEVSA